MEPGVVAVAVDRDHRGIVFVEFRAAPLLQLNDDVGRCAADRMAAGQDRVYPAAAQREPVLKQDLNIAQACLD